MITKNIGYAYATSDIAKFAGYVKTGCWFLAIYDDSKPMQTKDVIGASEVRERLFKMADDFEAPFGKYSMHLVQATEEGK